MTIRPSLRSIALTETTGALVMAGLNSSNTQSTALEGIQPYSPASLHWSHLPTFPAARVLKWVKESKKCHGRPYLSRIRHHGVSKAAVEYAVEYEQSLTGASSISYLLGKIANYLAIADELTKMTDAACQLDFVQSSNPQLQEEKSTGIETLKAEETVVLLFRELN